MNYSDTLLLTGALEIMVMTLRKDTKRKSILSTLVENMLRDILIECNKVNNRNSSGGQYWPPSLSSKEFREYIQKISSMLCNKTDTMKVTALIDDLTSLKRLITDSSNKKIRFTFFAQDFSVWPTYISVWEAIINCPDCEADLVYVPFNHVNQDNANKDFSDYIKNGYPIIKHSEYDFAKQSPDIVFIAKPYDSVPPEYFISGIREVTKRIAYVFYGFEAIGGPEMGRFHFGLLTHFLTWKHIVYADKCKEESKRYGYRNGTNVVVMGHPRLDILDSAVSVPDAWIKKINNRKVILWNTHHGLGDECPWGSFLYWRDLILSYFQAEKSMVLLWRPHPLFWGAVLHGNYMSSEEITNLKELVEESDNIILDSTPDYRSSIQISSAMISDRGSLLIEYLPLLKPILYTFKLEGNNDFDNSFAECYFKANKGNDVIDFLNSIKAEEVSKYLSKQEKLLNALGPVDGKNGNRIMHYLISELNKEVNMDVEALNRKIAVVR